MEKDQFDYVCMQTKQGRDVFVRYPDDGTEGRVLTCTGNQISYEDPQGKRHTYNYRVLEEITRSKEEWPRLN